MGKEGAVEKIRVPGQLKNKDGRLLELGPVLSGVGVRIMYR